jgi:hypothetical protein
VGKPDAIRCRPHHPRRSGLRRVADAPGRGVCAVVEADATSSPEPAEWPYLTRRVGAFLAAGASARRDAGGVILTVGEAELHLTPTGMRALPLAVRERLERMAGPP